MARRVRRLLLTALAGSIGCGEELVPASTLGAALFDDPKLSTSPFNAYACSTCHDVSSRAGSPANENTPPSRIDPGFNLYNVVHRPSWWGGERTRLLDAINYCLLEFMGGRELKFDEAQARQLYEFLAANSPDAPSPALPITVVKNISALSELPGDPMRGKLLWNAGCGRCHGEPHTAQGALTSRAGVVPELTVAVFQGRAREAVIEKVRHGKFFHIGGIMPLYSLETLVDQDLVHILAHLGL
jgi:thiosulfate dehydrogenase